MLFCCPVDTTDPRLPVSPAEENRHDQGMREPDLDAVHESIASTFEDGEIVVVGWIVDDGLDGVHDGRKGRTGGRDNFWGRAEVILGILRSSGSAVHM